LLRTILASATCPPKVRQYRAGIPSGKKHSQPRTGPNATTLGGDDSGFIGDTTVFDRYFSFPAALVRHKSAPLLRERERFLVHLEATGTRRSAIRIAATYLLQVVNILGLRSLRHVTIEEVDRAADIRDCPSPSRNIWKSSSRRCPANAGSRKRPFAGGDTVQPTFSNGTRLDIEDFAGFD